MGNWYRQLLDSGWRTAVAGTVLSIAAAYGICTRPLLTIAAFAALAAVWLFASWPFWAPALIISSDMLSYPITVVEERSVYASDLVIALAVPLLLRPVAWRRISMAIRTVGYPTALLLGFGTVTTLTATDRGASLAGLIQIAEYILALLIGIASIGTAEHLIRMFWVIVGGVWINCLFGLGQLFGLVPISTIALAANSDAARITGLSGNALGKWAVLGILLLSWLTLSNAWRPPAHRVFVLLGSMSFALLATGIRTALISVALGLLVSVILAGVGFVRLRIKPLVVAITAPVVALAGLMALNLQVLPTTVYGDRIAQIAQPTAYESGSTSYVRLRLWEVTVSMFSDNALFGVGLNNWNTLKYQYGLPQVVAGLETIGLNDPHHQILEQAAEGGLAALGATAYLLVASIRRVRRERGNGETRTTSGIDIVVLFVVVQLVAQLVGGDVGSDKTLFALIGGALGLAVACGSSSQDNRAHGAVIA